MTDDQIKMVLILKHGSIEDACGKWLIRSLYDWLQNGGTIEEYNYIQADYIKHHPTFCSID